MAANTGSARCALLWDMAGTLLSWDPVGRRPGAMPGIGAILPVLGREFLMAVTTGDTAPEARNLLRDQGLLDHFAGVYGSLGGPAGKPYGAVLRELGASPRHSLAVGDRLRSDVAADTADVVTLLVNQDGDRIHAEAVKAVIDGLGGAGADFAGAFDALLAGGEPAEGPADPFVARAARTIDPLPLQLLLYRHPALADDRRVIAI